MSLVLAVDQGTTNTKALLVDSVRRGSRPRSQRSLSVPIRAPGGSSRTPASCGPRRGGGDGVSLRPGPAPVAVGLPTSGSRSWLETARPAHRSDRSWAGRTPAPARCAATLVAAGARPRSAAAPACPSPRCSRHRRCAGCWTRPSRPARTRATSASGRSTRGWCGTSPAEGSSRRGRQRLPHPAAGPGRPRLAAGAGRPFGIAASALPEVAPRTPATGHSRRNRASRRAPVAAVMADSHAAFYEHGCTEPGTGKATYGTGPR